MTDDLQRLNGRYCICSAIEDVSLEVAHEIVDIRGDSRAALQLGDAPTAEQQFEYLKNYKIRSDLGEEIYYRVLEVGSGNLVGLFRMTNILDQRIFGWESFVIKQGARPEIALEAMALALSCGFVTLNRLATLPFFVPATNTRVLRMLQLCGLTEKIYQSHDGVWLGITRQAFETHASPLRDFGFIE